MMCTNKGPVKSKGLAKRGGRLTSGNVGNSLLNVLVSENDFFSSVYLMVNHLLRLLDPRVDRLFNIRHRVPQLAHFGRDVLRRRGSFRQLDQWGNRMFRLLLQVGLIQEILHFLAQVVWNFFED